MQQSIFIVDDNEMMRTFLRRFLARKYQVSTFSSAEDVMIEVAGGFVPNMMLVDLNLPGTSGHELIRKLRGNPAMRSTTFVVLSGVKKSQARIKCLEAGAADFISKPFNPKELEIRIDNLMRQKNLGVA